MLEQGRQSTSQELLGRIQFEKYDYLNPQPVYDTGAFLFRQCLHNADDATAVKIMRNFVPALERCKPKTPLLINDMIVPELNETTKFEENHFRQMDMAMMVVVGAKERTRKQLERVLKEADKRLKLVKVHEAGLVGLVEVQLVH